MNAALALHVALSLRLDAVEAYRLAHAYRDEELQKFADRLASRATLYGDSNTVIEVIRDLRQLAGEKATAPAPTATPDFFEVGRTYSEPGDTTDWRFRCDHITTHPEDGERTALGWRHFHGVWEPCAYGEDDFEIHQIADAIGIANQGDGK